MCGSLRVRAAGRRPAVRTDDSLAISAISARDPSVSARLRPQISSAAGAVVPTSVSAIMSRETTIASATKADRIEHEHRPDAGRAKEAIDDRAQREAGRATRWSADRNPHRAPSRRNHAARRGVGRGRRHADGEAEDRRPQNEKPRSAREHISARRPRRPPPRSTAITRRAAVASQQARRRSGGRARRRRPRWRTARRRRSARGSRGVPSCRDEQRQHRPEAAVDELQAEDHAPSAG